MTFLFLLFLFLSHCHPLFLQIPMATALPSTQKEEKNKQVLILETGESRTLSSLPFEKIWLSQAGIISIHDTGGTTLHIQARKEGEVLLNIGFRLYTVQVLNTEKKKALLAFNEMLSYRMGLKTHFEKNQIRIKGQLYRLKDFIDLHETAQKFNIDYLFEAEVHPSIRPSLKKYIKKKTKINTNILWKKPLTALIPENIPDFYQTQLKQIGLLTQKDPSLILSSLPLIELKILLVESSANLSFQSHIDWGGNPLHQILDRSVFKQILSSFQTMENEGRANIFSETTLVNQSGKKSHFHYGGEVPIPNFNPETGAQGVKWKPYGINMQFEAQADRNHKVHIKTRINISEIDHVLSGQSAPATKNNRLQTAITLQSGQSLLLSKLLRQQKGKSYSSPFPLSYIPLVGPLLSLKGKIKEKTRLSIFITVQILSPKTHSINTNNI